MTYFHTYHFVAVVGVFNKDSGKASYNVDMTECSSTKKQFWGEYGQGHEVS